MTLTTTGYGDVVAANVAGRMLAGVVMVCGILVFALLAGILATGYAEEMRRREFLRTWELVAKVPFFHNLGATLIAEVARLLRAREYPARAVIMRRGERRRLHVFRRRGRGRDRLRPKPLRLGAGDVLRRARAADRRAAQRDDRRGRGPAPCWPSTSSISASCSAASRARPRHQ